MTTSFKVADLVKDYSLGWRGERVRAVDGVSLRVPEKAIFGILGPNGSGKTTLLKIAVGLVRPTAGAVELFDRSSSDPEARRNVGFLPENPSFSPCCRAVELLRILGELSGLKGRALTIRVNDSLERLGLGIAAERKLSTYSRGMLQRFGIAQALLHDPDLLILDEPLSALDPVGRRLVVDLLIELKGEGKSVVFSSHLLGAIQGACDAIAVLIRGKLAATRSPDELLRRRREKMVAIGNWTDALEGPLREVLAKHGARIESAGEGYEELEDLYLRILDGGDFKELS